jgi:alpha-L-fucosidase
MDIGPRRDILGDLAREIKTTKSSTTGQKLHWGVYHSLFEWFSPLFLKDKANNWTTRSFVEGKTMPELYDLVNKYEPELIWSDGCGAPNEYWKAPEFLAWYATNSTVADAAIWNDRWGEDIICHHGAYVTCNDRYQPGKLVEKKWENALTIDDDSWGFDRNKTGAEYLSVEYFVHELIETVAFGGNMLLNVGPAADGTIPAIFWDRLLGIGDWLKVNGDAIYKTKPWKVAQNQTDVGAYYTTKDSTVYALVTRWPKDNRLVLSAPTPTTNTQVRMVGLGTGKGELLEWNYLGAKEFDSEAGIIIEVPPLTPDVIPCQHAWAFAMTKILQVNKEKRDDIDEDPVDLMRMTSKAGFPSET